MKTILLTRVTCQSTTANEKGFHVLDENKKLHNGTYSGLLCCSYKKVPKPFITLEIEDNLYNMLTIPLKGWKDKSRELGFQLLKSLILEKHGIK